MILQKRKKYLQIAINGGLNDARQILPLLPASDNIIVEAGTPLLKELGISAIAEIRAMVSSNTYLVADIKCADLADRAVSMVAGKKTRPIELVPPGATNVTLNDVLQFAKEQFKSRPYIQPLWTQPYQKLRGANAATVLGVAPVETISLFIEECKKSGIDAMVDMMNVETPLAVLKKLKNPPDVVILHRGVDETEFSREKQIPYYQIKQIKGNYDVLVAVAGGDTIREVQRAFFNDADIVVVWKNFFQASSETARLAREFLKEIG